MAHKPIFLIGMPGCGKSTLGAALAEALDLPFADLDTRIEALAGQSIPRIFAEHGEAAFRALEHQALEQAASEPAQVIATGGGAILREDNVSLMRASGLVLWIERPLEQILSDLQHGTRPLLAEDPAERLRALHAQREPLYRAAAHLRLANLDTPGKALTNLLAMLDDLRP